jgi:hypothetical protein
MPISYRLGILACAVFLLSPLAARAEESSRTTANDPVLVDVAAPAPVLPAVPASTLDRAEKRPVALSTLYGSYATLQVLDLVSTRKAIAAGAHEANPLMGNGSTARMMLVKGAGASVSMYLAERMWKKNRVGAIVTMAVMNGVTAAVVARNARLARR